jgi:hypothetical protein
MPVRAPVAAPVSPAPVSRGYRNARMAREAREQQAGANPGNEKH